MTWVKAGHGRAVDDSGGHGLVGGVTLRRPPSPPRGVAGHARAARSERLDQVGTGGGGADWWRWRQRMSMNWVRGTGFEMHDR